jgi:hypothetical protein
MRASRLPVLVMVVAALVVGSLAVNADDATEGERSADTTDVRALAPTAASPDVLSSTWYCAAGSAGDITVPAEDGEEPVAEEPAEGGEEPVAEEPAEGGEEPVAVEVEPTPPIRAEHSVVIVNMGEADRRAQVSVHAGGEEPVIVDVDVPALSSETIDLVDHAEGPAVAALVEVDGGDVAVSHQLVGDTGIDAGPCASTSSDVWHFAWGDTSRDVAEVITVFNPFPGDAVVDFRFSTGDGIREPRALTGLVVPGHSVVVADVSAEATRHAQVSATVTARAGRVVAERMQIAEGSEREDGRAPRRGLAVDLGVPEPALIWTHPFTWFSQDVPADVVVYNPSDQPAAVDVEVALGEQVVGGVAPFELNIRPRSFEVVRLTDESRLVDVFGEDLGRFAVTVRSVNGVPVVADVVTTFQSSGWASSPGGNVVGVATVFGGPLLGEPGSSVVALTSLEAEAPTTVSLVAIGGGTREVLEEIELAPGERIEVVVEELGLDGDQDALVVESSSPVAAELATRWTDPDGYSVRTGVVRVEGAISAYDALG